MKSSASSDGSDPSLVQEIDAEIKATLETELKSWSASSAKELNAAETEREYKLPTPPDWKCIICKTSIYIDPVYQCQTGHLACYTCSQSGNNCRECSKAVSRIKNLAVEDIMNSLVVTCKFANLGCKEVMDYGDLEHENNCSFAPMVCPLPSCSQAGVKNLLAQHLLSKHKISFMVDVVKGGYRNSCEFFPFGCSRESEKFELDSSTTSVMVRHPDSKELHLLLQESTTVEDRLQITSLTESCKRKYALEVTIREVTESCKRKYALEVTIREEQTYCLKSVSNMRQGGQLVIRKQRGDDTLKKRCKIYMDN